MLRPKITTVIIATLMLALGYAAHAQIVTTLPFQLQNGTTADATQVMADFNQIVNNTNTNAAKNGANSDITSLSGLTTPLTPAQGGSSVYVGATGGGTANAQTIATLVPTGFTLAAGKRIVFIAGATNTGPMTLSANSTTATNVYYPTPSGPQALVGGEVKSGNIVEVWYDGTQYQLITNNLSLLGPLNNLASAATADLGTVPTHNVNITGAVGITSFGSSASVTYPIYYLTFASTPTLTYNATSMILPGSANITAAAGDSAVAQYLGSGNWKVWSYQRASGANVVATTPLCGANGLVIANNAGTPNTNVDVTANNVVMVNSSNVTQTANNVSVTINSTTVGANGLDAGSLAASTWYYIYLINNGTTTAGLASTSSTAPTMPSGYAYKCLLGAMQTDGSSNFYRIRQVGNIGSYTVVASTNTAVLPFATSGAIGTISVTSPVLASYTVTGNNACAPTIATGVYIIAYPNYKGNGTGSVLVAPSTGWGYTNSGPQGSAGLMWPIYAASANNSQQGYIPLESSAIGWAGAGTGSAIVCQAWKLSVNAN